jgi:hypothetical protein
MPDCSPKRCKSLSGALKGLFLQILILCREAKLVKLGHVALDGTKIKANASKHKAMSYGRMHEKEKELEREVNELLRKAEPVDAEEDKRSGRGIRGDEFPEEPRFREKRLATIRQAKKALEERIFGQIKDVRGFRRFLLSALHVEGVGTDAESPCAPLLPSRM